MGRNISSKVLTDPEVRVLRKGMKCNVKPTKQDIVSFIANVDSGIDIITNISEEFKYELKQKVASSLNHFKPRNNLDKEEIEAIKSDKTITIVPADKGNTTVVIDSDAYKSKCEEHLSDISTYHTIDNFRINPNKTLQNKVNSTLRELKIQYKHMYVNSPTNPLFYTTIKIHKDNDHIRPIVSLAYSQRRTCRPPPSQK